jgi:hypothetical protein
MSLTGLIGENSKRRYSLENSNPEKAQPKFSPSLKVGLASAGGFAPV